MNFDIENRIIYKTIHGSRAYGTNTETSDLDIRGIVICPMDIYLGVGSSFEQHIPANEDSVFYDIRKFFNLASQCNPNILEIINTEKQHVLFRHPVFGKIEENKDIFISARAKHTFSGYMIAQVKRIKSHRDWILNPPKSKPERKDFGLSETKKAKNQIDSEIGAAENLSETQYYPDEVMELFAKEKRYASALARWNQYCNWKNTRNKKRAELEEKYLYDTKHGMHVVRLGLMCEEILSGKGIIVNRPDAKLLLEIRNGAWKYEELLMWAEEQEQKCQKLYDNLKVDQNRIIPMIPDMKKISDLCCETICEFNKMP